MKPSTSPNRINPKAMLISTLVLVVMPVMLALFLR